MKHIHLKREPQLLAKMAAFSYQADAVEAIRNLEYAAIFHEQGLGKTKIAIDLILWWLQETDIDTVLVVTKNQKMFMGKHTKVYLSRTCQNSAVF